MLATIYRNRATDLLTDSIANLIVRICDKSDPERKRKSIANAKINLVEYIDESNIRPTKNGERQQLKFAQCADKNAKVELTVNSKMLDDCDVSQPETIRLEH